MLLMLGAAVRSALAAKTAGLSWNCPFSDWKTIGPLPNTENGVVVAGVWTLA